MTVQWKTDEISDSLIRYGLTGGPLNLQDGSIIDVTTHIFVLTNLTPGTSYDYTVESIDPSGNGPMVSSVVSFSTSVAADTTAPEFVLDPVADSYSENQATNGASL